ncbi:hypothetical protein [Variovorax atrisoli]|uniref:hypothetical protein n=1 Tax=Variovorax atrisoli TaxID=3394203 RepID=UPI001616A868|nr:hypothetical protein [Variovorax sp. BK613]MBB3642047.1 hypothetical protein [Variovorax sp. BK613]
MNASTANDSLTPLDISQAVLEGEENPNAARPLTPKERAARGMRAEPGRRARLQGMLRSPAVAWCGAAATGLALAVLYARRTHRI